jgi:hypothetical protein
MMARYNEHEQITWHKVNVQGSRFKRQVGTIIVDVTDP